jgi:mycothiol synthase
MHRTAGPSIRAAVTIRPAGEADLGRIVEIANAVFPDFPETLEEAEAFETRLRAGNYVSVHALAETPGGEAVGFARVRHMPGQFDPSRYHLAVFTHPGWRRRGIGGALYDWALEDLRVRGARCLESFARETEPETVAFLEERGFRERMRTWEMRLDLARCDPAPFAHYHDRARSAGVIITTLGDEYARDPSALRRAYELHNAVLADIPSPVPFTPPPFEHYLRSTVDSPRALLDAYFIAKIGDRYVGEANLQRPSIGSALYHNVTGVLRPYRGRGIAMALKLATIAYGRAHGYTEIRTWNETNNTGMLAINDRLGFVRQPAWITFEKTLAPAAPSP